MILDVLLWIPDPDFFPSRIPDSGVKKSTGSRIRIRNTVLSPIAFFFLCVRSLESLKIMDYSLLVGIHNIDQAVVAGGGGGVVQQQQPPVSCSMPYR